MPAVHPQPADLDYRLLSDLKGTRFQTLNLVRRRKAIVEERPRLTVHQYNCPRAARPYVSVHQFRSRRCDRSGEPTLCDLSSAIREPILLSALPGVAGALIDSVTCHPARHRPNDTYFWPTCGRCYGDREDRT
jgi:hypothetical protein